MMLKSRARGKSAKIKRRYIRKHLYETYSGRDLRYDFVDESHANLISSKTEDGFHAPVLDIDFEAQLIPSMSDGHYHLYLDKRLTTRQYKKLLDVMVDIGLLEKNWVEKNWDSVQSTCVRKPTEVVKDNFGVDDSTYDPFEQQ